MSPSHLFFLSQLPLYLFLLREELTGPTLAIAAGTVLLRWRQVRPPRWIPQVAGAALFVLAFLEHGLRINPEMGLNLLVAVVALKLLEAREERDWRMLTLGLFLLWATGALFVKTPLYFACALTGSAAALLGLTRLLGERVAVEWRELLKWVARALPVAAVLFFFLPRFSANVWMPPPAPSEGVVGFSEDARPGDVEELRPTGAPAFHAVVTPRPASRALYWRGATLSAHDGWNWHASPLDGGWTVAGAPGRMPAPGWIRQEIIHHRPVSRAFALPLGQWVVHQGKESASAPGNTWKLVGFAQWRRYTVLSDPRDPGDAPMGQEGRALTTSVAGTPPLSAGTDLDAHLGELERFFQGGFTYSLSPGRTPDLRTFLQNQRGWCSHYASATALALRAAGHPARLVSGYLGGEYHPHGGYWTVSEDDAHVWVEAWDGTRWRVVDPTGWVAPERLALSGGEYLRRARNSGRLFSGASLPGWARELQGQWNHLNFRFLVWSEDFDRETQKRWAKALDWNLARFYSAGLMALGLGILGWWLRELWRTREKVSSTPRQRAWEVWREWWAVRGVELLPHWSPREWRAQTQGLAPEDKEFARRWSEAWEKEVYGEGTREGLAGLMRELKAARTRPGASARRPR